MIKKSAKTVIYIAFLFSILSLSFGCATKSTGISDATADASASDQVNKRVRDYLEANEDDYDEVAGISPKGQSVLMRTARTALGTPYVRGGTNPDGFDCSGFVQWTFNHVGVKLPRTAREQSRVGRAIRNIDDMQVGDIVAFRHPKRGYHTGIYVGDGKFIHSPRKRTVVRINALSDPYFSKTFLGARRIKVTDEAEIAAAEKMLAEYRQQEQKKGSSKKSTVATRNTASKKKNSSVARSSQKNKIEKKGTQAKNSQEKAKASSTQKSKTTASKATPSKSKSDSAKKKQSNDPKQKNSKS